MQKVIILKIILISILLISRAYSQDTACCRIKYKYDIVEFGNHKPSGREMKIEYYCKYPLIKEEIAIGRNDTIKYLASNSPVTAIYKTSDEARKNFQTDTLFIFNDSFYYKFNDSFIKLFSDSRFYYDKDTIRWYSYFSDADSKYKYLCRNFIPLKNDYQTEDVFRSKTFTVRCRAMKNGKMVDCDTIQSGFALFHPYFGFVRFGEGNHSYYEISNYKCVPKSSYYYGNCQLIIDIFEFYLNLSSFFPIYNPYYDRIEM